MRRMRGYLAYCPGKLSFTELPFDTFECKESFVGGRMERISLAENIDIWVAEDTLTGPPFDKVSILILDGNDSRLALGKLFLATTDQDGQCVPLSWEQGSWLRNHLSTGVNRDDSFYKIIDLQAVRIANAGLIK
ncbi:hypothetical protein [Planomicrobium okeanokoites]|uniref:hypothetical protein n=1 Tax=Planomicrobium okeanokoites TaxID=244 RepID=UPI0009FF70EA|nr:hypothetical protein [Planomicrobium okeanokoites]